MPRIAFDTPEELADDLAGFLGLPRADLGGRVTDRNWRPVALIYRRLLDLIEEGATYFARAQRIRQNPEWAPDRPIRAEVKLARVNAKVDSTERELLDALNISPPTDAEQSRAPLAPRSAAYFIPVLEAEADRQEGEARNRAS